MTSKAAADDLHRQLLLLREHPGRQAQPDRCQGHQRGPRASRRSTSRAAPRTRSTSSGTVLHFLMFGGTAAPRFARQAAVWAYGKRIHDYCERRSHYDAGEYVEEWGDEGAKKGLVPLQDGLQGPLHLCELRARSGSTTHISWPIMAGHGCMGCTEPAFWDTMAPLEKPIQDGHDRRRGEDRRRHRHRALTVATAAGVAAHAAAHARSSATAVRTKKDETPHKE